jgi:hypothetical protein
VKIRGRTRRQCLPEVVAMALGTPQQFTLRPGADVEVRCRFDNHWSRGFEVAAVENEVYRLRRRSDGAVLPATFGPGDVRPRAG